MPSGMLTELRLAIAALLHKCTSPLIVGRDDLIFEAEFHCQFAGPGLFRYPGVGTALDDETLTMNRFDDAAEPRRCFKKSKRHAVGGQLISGRQAAYAATDDRDHRAATGVERDAFADKRAKPPRARSSRAAVSSGESFRDCGRTTSRPMEEAKLRKPMSMS